MRQREKFRHAGLMRFLAPAVAFAFCFLLFPADYDSSIPAIGSSNLARTIQAGRSLNAERWDVAQTGFSTSWIPAFRIVARLASVRVCDIRSYSLSGESVRAPPRTPSFS